MSNFVLLTGATGFLGSHLLEELLSKGFSVIITVRSSSDCWRIKHLEGCYEKWMTNQSASNFDELFNKYKISTIIHLATEYGRQTSFSSVLEANVIFPVKLIEAGMGKGLKQFINTDTFLSKDSIKSSYLNEYSQSKKILKNFLIGKSKDINVVNMRLEHIYGAKDADSKFVTQILRQLVNHDNQINLTEGKQARDFIYVKDVAEAYLLVATKHEHLQGFMEMEVGRGETTTVRDFVEKMKLLSKSPSILNFGGLPNRVDEIMESAANNSGLVTLGWTPQYDIIKGLSDLIQNDASRLIIDTEAEET